MDKWTRIRRDVLAGEISRRQAVKKYNLNFRTIQKVLRKEWGVPVSVDTLTA